MTLELHSPAFGPMQTIPQDYTCEGMNLSPPLDWLGVPVGTLTLLLTCDDPDAPRGVFHHWAAYNIPASTTAIAAGAAPGEAALNDFGKPGYGGPCPPRGARPHHYIFRLAALDTRLAPPARAGCAEVAKLAEGHVLAEARLIGRFGR